MINNKKVGWQNIINSCPLTIKELIKQLGDNYSLTKDGITKDGITFIPEMCFYELEKIALELNIDIIRPNFATGDNKNEISFLVSFMQIEKELKNNS